MADSSTLRARRSRLHAAGDHSLCRVERCSVVAYQEASLPSVLTDEVGLRASGARLWREMTAAGALGPMQSVLLLEACRITDRLDALDRQLAGHDWLRFRHNPEDEHEVTVYVDRVLAEAREQAVALKGLLAELRQMVGAQKPTAAKGASSGISDLAARIAARRTSAS